MSAKNQGPFSKTNFYHSNGTGRDTYIAINSGGLTAANQRFNYPASGQFLQINKSRVTFGAKQQNSQKFVQYHSNGSGRDNYIIHSSGGFINPHKTQNIFKDSLRSTQCNLNQRTKKFEQNPSRQTYQNYERSQARQQRIQSAKLSRPRITAIPFSHYVDKAVQKQVKMARITQQDKEIYSNYC